MRMNTTQCLADTHQLLPPPPILTETPISIIGLMSHCLLHQVRLLRRCIHHNNLQSVILNSRGHTLRSQITIQQPMHSSQALHLLRMQHILHRKTPPQPQEGFPQELLSHLVAMGTPDFLEAEGMKM
jgi:hypothetical protein